MSDCHTQTHLPPQKPHYSLVTFWSYFTILSKETINILHSLNIGKMNLTQGTLYKRTRITVEKQHKTNSREDTVLAKRH